jgi:hypothetical protein
MIERYATASAWAEWFEKESGVKISRESIRQHLFRAGKAAKTLRSQFHHDIEIFSERDVWSSCAGLLKPLPQAGADGFAKIRGVRHGTFESLARSLGVSTIAIKSRVKTSSLSPSRGRDVRGRLFDLYPEPAVRELLNDLLAPLPQAGEDGFAEIGGIRHTTIHILARSLEVSAPTVKSRILAFHLKPIRGKDCYGHPAYFYSETEVRKLLTTLLDPLPRVGPDGFAEIGGVRFGSVFAFTRTLGISAPAITNRIRLSSLKSVRGRLLGGQLVRLYSEPQIRRLCANLLVSLPRVGSDGFVAINGVRHRTIRGFERILAISDSSIKSRLTSSGLRAIRGRSSIGNLIGLFPEPAVRELCRDLIERKKSNSISR